jgi:NADH-quinone oxidoreductase subunit L
MSIAVWMILGPLLASVVILGVRRWSTAIALFGAAIGLMAALITLGRVDAGDPFIASFPGLPGMLLRITIDPINALVSTTVATVATLVLLYAVGYMAADHDQPRFFAEMNLFVAAMQALVLAGDWILLLAAWELIGVTSYLLIGFWFARPGTGPAATRAFVVTRAADVGLYIGVFALVAGTGTTAIAASQEHASGTAATIAGLGFLLAIVGKSAQVPLQGWLLDAMAGPTPVSALLHAATLVVAGVVLMIRAFPFLPSELLLALGLVGGISSVVTGVIAIGQGDLKRLLAASTSSQLGLMFLALGAGSVPAALLHLVAHAAMKSALFLGAGVFQHVRGTTGFDDLGGIGRRRKGTFVAISVAGLALAGLPPLAGFWSKDSIIAATLDSSDAVLLVPLALAGTLLTGVYVAHALRLLWNEADGAGQAQDAVRVAGIAWMGTGLTGLTFLAATLGLAVEPIGRLLGTRPPEDVAGLVLGLIAAVTGLFAGWGMPATRLLGPFHGAARDGFQVNGGLVGLVAAPALTVGSWCDGIDRFIHGQVLGFGRSALGLSQRSLRLDMLVHRGVERLGSSATSIAAATRQTDETGIDGLIAWLVARTRRLGGEARELQTGLVHRELLFAVSGAAVIMILILILSLEALL